MTEKIELNLITGRTIQQGVSMEGGKEKSDYRDACGILELDPVDLKKLGLWEGSPVRVTSSYGSVVVKVVKTKQGPHPGLGWIPMGPWANRLTDPNTYSMGMPTFKGIPVVVESAPNEKVLLSLEVIEQGLLEDD
ncbi:molybdopterin dinucleotide-binding region [Methanolacinia petrolearia DSM 11571]|uniref:Molybdopterin dinucleotide-binding region n=1 Tax=Methanolacinia petrolearia (strain DSM 11571 / OCM 486 / SEBR 4847) TaxID=679926 RepID=E1RH81_METP4|nr:MULTISPECIES: molybdopterin dinucleotide binding domain-containing protein [Methanolacinia]ADN36385.1 molybdopterin dinucleotide-binding region [Methanolacinia petrolearia DSM 11571]